MARFTGTRGLLAFTTTPPTTTVEFRPTAGALKQISRSEDAGIAAPTLLTFDEKAGRVIIRPISTNLTSERFCRPKYARLRTLNLPLRQPAPQTADQLSVFLTSLPHGLTRDPEFGLGFPREFDPLVRAIEAQTAVTELYFSDDRLSLVEETQFVISFDAFDEIQKELNRIIGRAQSASLEVREVAAHNWMCTFTGQEPAAYRRRRHPMVQTFIDAASGVEPIDDAAVEELVETVSRHSEAISRSRPDALAKLRSDIELVELDSLLTRFEQMLAGSHDESYWQRFFEANPFVLSFTTGHPLMLVQSQASVGGRNLAGIGGKITDFLTKNASTDNLAIFEIKRPDTRRREEVQGCRVSALERPERSDHPSLESATPPRELLVRPEAQHSPRRPRIVRRPCVSRRRGHSRGPGRASVVRAVPELLARS